MPRRARVSRERPNGEVVKPSGSKFAVLGHRGASAEFGDNTAAAFRACWEMGADGAELDVRRSADGVLVVVHDPTLPDGRLVHQTLADDMGPDILRLDQAFAALDGQLDGRVAAPREAGGIDEAMIINHEMIINVEIKNLPHDPGFEPDLSISRQVAAELQRLGRRHGILVSSFHRPTALAVAEADPDVRIGMLTMGGRAEPNSFLTQLAAAGFAAVHPHDAIADAAFIDHARSVGLEVYVWTVDDLARIAELVSLGASGVITNTPRAVLGSLGRDLVTGA